MTGVPVVAGDMRVGGLERQSLWNFNRNLERCAPDLAWSFAERQAWAAKFVGDFAHWLFSDSQLRMALAIGDRYRSGFVDRANLWTMREAVEAAHDCHEAVIATACRRVEFCEVDVNWSYHVYMPEEVAAAAASFRVAVEGGRRWALVTPPKS